MGRYMCTVAYGITARMKRQSGGFLSYWYSSGIGIPLRATPCPLTYLALKVIL